MGGIISKKKSINPPKSSSYDQIQQKLKHQNIQSAISFTKSPDIVKDGIDYQLNKRLKQLGPVEVEKLKINFQNENNMIKILENRMKDSFDLNPINNSTINQNSSSIKPISIPLNRLKISMICDLLDQNKLKPISSLNSIELERILGDQKVDSDTLNYLVKSFNTISLREVKNPDPTIHQPIQMAVWVSQPK
ncbi:hypothetical protein O181_083570 [Austropuccinia psidii MF-1]|uniref:Uncharacterized protein n=1 Tax=Austropuccinia psidii MF-1 TaxID=1389203 RepID=A0A9Q3FNE8_9BASI|nr:hypothetical protein [Austropuccinia psidii MF-1]